MVSGRLFSAYTLAGLELRNRAVMAPMTRSRASAPELAPPPMAAVYYGQRASAGLIVSEGAVVSEQARGYARTPGLYSAAQEAGWKLVTEAVHREGGRIFAQLWHCGRVSHRSLRADGAPPVGPGDVAARGSTYGLDPRSGEPLLMPCDVPRALSTQEARKIGAEFAAAARRAMAAGFDGVEVHGANGYLFDQFRCPYVNRRSDEYGGSLENRCRLLLDAAAAVAGAIGEQRVGVRLSPLGTANDMRHDPEPRVTYGYLARQLDGLGIAYIHLNDQGEHWIHNPGSALIKAVRGAFSRTLILCGGFDAERGEAALRAGSGDLIAFGRPYISNPDLVERMQHGHPLAPYDSRTFFGGGTAGYVDYPPYEESRLRRSAA